MLEGTREQEVPEPDVGARDWALFTLAGMHRDNKILLIAIIMTQPVVSIALAYVNKRNLDTDSKDPRIDVDYISIRRDVVN